MLLDSKVISALNQYVDSRISNLPNMKEKYYSDSPNETNEWILHHIVHDLRHESVMVFMNTKGRFPNDLEQNEISDLINKRLTDIARMLKVLHWV